MFLQEHYPADYASAESLARPARSSKLQKCSCRNMVVVYSPGAAANILGGSLRTEAFRHGGFRGSQKVFLQEHMPTTCRLSGEGIAAAQRCLGKGWFYRLIEVFLQEHCGKLDDTSQLVRCGLRAVVGVSPTSTLLFTRFDSL